jgi:mRNA interferase MazF
LSHFLLPTVARANGGQRWPFHPKRLVMKGGHTVLAMITSASNPPWPMDVTINANEARLQAPSKVRMRLFTLDNRLILHRAGGLSRTDQRAVLAVVRKLLAS